MRPRVPILCSILIFVVVGLNATAQQLGSEIPISAPGELVPVQVEFARVGSNGTDFLAAWRDDRANGDVYAARVDSQGTVLDRTGIHLAPAQTVSAVASDGRDYLVALTDYCSSVSVVHVGSDGTVGEPKELAKLSGLCAGAELASNGETYLAVWMPGTAALLDHAGEVVAGPFKIGSFERSVVVASNGHDYMVAGSTANSGALIAVPVSRRGEVGIAHNLAAGRDPAVAIASDGSNYAIVTDSLGILANIISPDGSVIIAISNPFTAGQFLYPRVVRSGTRYFVSGLSATATASSLQTVFLDPATGALSPAGYVSNVAADFQRYDITPSATKTLIAWLADYTLKFAVVSAAELSSQTEIAGKRTSIISIILSTLLFIISSRSMD